MRARLHVLTNLDPVAEVMIRQMLAMDGVAPDGGVGAREDLPPLEAMRAAAHALGLAVGRTNLCGAVYVRVPRAGRLRAVARRVLRRRRFVEVAVFVTARPDEPSAPPPTLGEAVAQGAHPDATAAYTVRSRGLGDLELYDVDGYAGVDPRRIPATSSPTIEGAA